MKPWSRLAPKDRRAVLVGASILAPVLAFTLVGKPYLHERAALAEQIHEQEELLRRELALVQSVSRLSGDLTDANRVLADARPRLFPARDPLGATAALVSTASEFGRRHGLLVEAVEGRPAESLSDGFMSVQVEIRGRGDLEGLVRWLNALETGPKLLRVEQLTVVRVGSEAQADSLDAETLSFAATVRGFLMARTSSDSPVVSVADARDRP